MILPDVNVLVFAYREEAADHDRYASWLAELVAGAGELALVESSLIGFVRIVTNPRIMDDPAPASEALAFVAALRDASRARWLAPTKAVWTRLASLVDQDSGVRANLVPDAWLAALALAHGSRLATADRGFARFDGLDWFDPARP